MKNGLAFYHSKFKIQHLKFKPLAGLVNRRKNERMILQQETGPKEMFLFQLRAANPGIQVLVDFQYHDYACNYHILSIIDSVPKEEQQPI